MNRMQTKSGVLMDWLWFTD